MRRSLRLPHQASPKTFILNLFFIEIKLEAAVLIGLISFHSFKAMLLSENFIPRGYSCCFIQDGEQRDQAAEVRDSIQTGMPTVQLPIVGTNHRLLECGVSAQCKQADFLAPGQSVDCYCKTAYTTFLFKIAIKLRSAEC